MRGTRAKNLRRQAQAEVPQEPRIVRFKHGKRPLRYFNHETAQWDIVVVEPETIIIAGWPRRYEELKRAWNEGREAPLGPMSGARRMKLGDAA